MKFKIFFLLLISHFMCIYIQNLNIFSNEFIVKKILIQFNFLNLMNIIA